MFEYCDLIVVITLLFYLLFGKRDFKIEINPNTKKSKTDWSESRDHHHGCLSVHTFIHEQLAIIMG